MQKPSEERWEEVFLLWEKEKKQKVAWGIEGCGENEILFEIGIVGFSEMWYTDR